MNPKPRFVSERGMTLVEVVIVIAVVGILAAVAAPTVNNALKRERAKGFAHEVANMLREARNQAQSRGEAMRVLVYYDLDGSTPGYISVHRTNKRLPDGSFGGGVCDSETEGISTFDCTDGSVCISDVCEAPPARSCRELDAPPDWSSAPTMISGDTRYTRVVYHDFPETGASNLGVRVAYSGNSTRQFCFSPRGTVEKFGGGFVTPFSAGGSGYSCLDESFNVWVADRSYATGWSSVLTHMRCDATAADYEEVRGHVVRVLPNGEIGLRPPRKP